MRHFFKCDDCGLIFRDGEGGTFKDHMGVTDPYPVYVTFQCCPECRCADLNDVEVCSDCGENEVAPGDDELCLDCRTMQNQTEAKMETMP